MGIEGYILFTNTHCLHPYFHHLPAYHHHSHTVAPIAHNIIIHSKSIIPWCHLFWKETTSTVFQQYISMVSDGLCKPCLGLQPHWNTPQQSPDQTEQSPNNNFRQHNYFNRQPLMWNARVLKVKGHLNVRDT